MEFINRNKIFGPILIVWLIFTLACSTSKDIYRNPYQLTIQNSPIASHESLGQQQSVQKQAPEWIYAVSRDFVVGYGQGRNIMEAKGAALNDLKAFIIKSLGETGKIVEVNFVSNSATGRNDSESLETYVMKHQFESKYTPVVNVSIDRFENYYHEASATSAKYYIKYRIDASELQRIKDEYDASVQRQGIIAGRIHRAVDSLITLKPDSDLESIIERYNTISDFFYSTELDDRDSLKLVRGLQNINYFLNTVEIRILEHDQGKHIRFGLFNSQSPVRTREKPYIISSGIIQESLFQQDGIWDLKYRTVDNIQSPGSVEISYSLPQYVRSTKVIVPKPATIPVFEITDKINLKVLQKDYWNGIVKTSTVRVNIIYNKTYPCTLSSLELRLHSVNFVQPIIHLNNLNLALTAGVNSLAVTVENALPLRLFLTRETNCDLVLYYRSENNLEKFHLSNIPLTINQ